MAGATIIRIAFILFFASVVSGVVGYTTLPPVAAKAAKVLFGLLLAASLALILATIFVPAAATQP